MARADTILKKMGSQELQHILDATWTTQDIIVRFKVTAMTVHVWRTNKGLPCIVVKGSARDTVRFIPDEVRRWAREHGKRIYD